MDMLPGVTDPTQRLALEAAHELGNVVVALRGFARLLANTIEPDSDSAELAARINDCVEALGEVTARLQRVGRADLPPEEFRSARPQG